MSRRIAISRSRDRTKEDKEPKDDKEEIKARGRKKDKEPEDEEIEEVEDGEEDDEDEEIRKFREFKMFADSKIGHYYKLQLMKHYPQGVKDAQDQFCKDLFADEEDKVQKKTEEKSQEKKT